MATGGTGVDIDTSIAQLQETLEALQETQIETSEVTLSYTGESSVISSYDQAGSSIVQGI